MADQTLSPMGQSNQTLVVSVSILYVDARESVTSSDEPKCFPDLLLDQVIAQIIKGHEDHELLPFFYNHLTLTDDIEYRHEVWRDLQEGNLESGLRQFTAAMREVRQRFAWAKKTYYVQHRNGLHLDAVTRYCAAIQILNSMLQEAIVRSRALMAFRSYLITYESSASFQNLAATAAALTHELSTIRYNVNVKGPRVRVLKYDGEADYGKEIEEAFERFQQGEVDSYLAKYSDWPDMNHVEAQIADRVARLYSDVFDRVQEFVLQTDSFIAQSISSFDRELHFYFTYLDYISPMKLRGLPFCLPQVSGSKEIFAKNTFDIALASKLISEPTTPVTNDFHLSGQERIIIVSGPNQGGKTTFARNFGQLHFLGSLGCPVPGTTASLFLFDELFTHFGREEDATYTAGKLEDDLLRIQSVLRHMSPSSVVIMNEIFSSTTAHDALALGTRVLERIIELDALCIIVSFIDELTLLSPSIVSMTSSVNPEDPAMRTFKILRHPADGLAYAISIAEKYGLTYELLRKRISS